MQNRRIISMANESERKIKLLKIWDILSRETDEAHPMPSSVLLDRLAEAGIECGRKALYDDIRVLNKFGYEICTHRSVGNEYYVIDRDFELPEVKVLMDAVQAANFISDKRADILLDKIAHLAGSHRAEILKKNIVQYSTVKTPNEAVMYSIDSIVEAIYSGKKISFQYFNYDIGGKRKYRMRFHEPTEIRTYIVNPVWTVYDDDRYYLLCYSDTHESLVPYRIDKMDKVQILEEDITPNKAIEKMDLSVHRKTMVNMFTGTPTKVYFEGDRGILDAVYERFGTGTRVHEKDENTITFSVDVQISGPFYAWVAGFGKKLKITAPQEAVEGITKQIKEALSNYEEVK